MRFDLPSQLLLLSSLPFLITSLPSQPRNAFLERRYSVVAVDGSSDSTAVVSPSEPAAATTIDVTETVTGPTKTVTPTTEILSTVTVQVTQPASTSTLPASTVLKTVTRDTTVSISVVDVAGPSTTDCETTTTPTSSAITTPTSTSISTTTSSLVSQYPTLPVPIPTTTTLYTTALPTYKPSSIQWHTTYPIWNTTSTVATYATASASAVSTGGVWWAL